MSQFKYTLPSGATFTMDAPDGTTQIEADFIFYSQVASGALVGFEPGQRISGTPSAEVKFALSRLDRGTAGVDDRVILSIINGIPSISSIPNLINVPLVSPINQADFANINANNTFTPTPIGPLNSDQVQGLMAQLANLTNQEPTDITVDGVGIYGLLCEQLEQAGYVKPGTYLQFIANDPNGFISTMNSPGIWTGLNGIYSLDDFLNSLSDQNTAQLTLMQNGYESLTATGVISPPVTQSITPSQGYVYTQSGLQTVSAISISTGVAITGTNNQSDLANTPLSSLLSTPLAILGSLASGAVNLSRISPAITSALKNTITGDIGALVNNASKYGTQVATEWAKSAGLGDISKLTTLNFGSITSGINNLPGALTGLTTDIQNLDVLGKASQFASGFSSPLTSLSNLGNFNLNSVPNLSSLTSGLPSLTSLTSGLPNLTSLTSGLPSLSNLSSLGNFSSLTNLGSLGNLGNLGGLFGGGGDSLVSATKVAAGFTNTVNRSVVDAAFVRVLGNSKIPTPFFSFPSPGATSLNASIDITAAQNILAGIRNTGSRLLAQTQSTVTGFGISGGGFGGFLQG